MTPTHDTDTDSIVEGPYLVGDVALDLAQGRPVHIIKNTGQTARQWSDKNDYELTENYGNSRLGTSPDDQVFEVVYCSNAKSRPSKTYAMPESRLLRVETEAADNGPPVHARIARDVLEQLFDAAYRSGGDQTVSVLEGLAQDVVGKDVTAEARELASVEYTLSTPDGADSDDQ